MAKESNKNNPGSISESRAADDLLGNTEDLISREIPPGVDRRDFLIRSAVVGAAAVMTGRFVSASERVEKAVASMPPKFTWTSPRVSQELNVVKQSKGPVLTTVDEFYKVGPGPSSSHTIGPMRITYDFYQRAAKLPADQLAKATNLQVNLFGSLSATGKGHGTERAALAGLVARRVKLDRDDDLLEVLRGRAGRAAGA